MRAIDQYRQAREVAERIRRLMMDEFGLFSDTAYHVVMADTQQMLCLGEGRARIAILYMTGPVLANRSTPWQWYTLTISGISISRVPPGAFGIFLQGRQHKKAG